MAIITSWFVSTRNQSAITPVNIPITTQAISPNTKVPMTPQQVIQMYHALVIVTFMVKSPNSSSTIQCHPVSRQSTQYCADAMLSTQHLQLAFESTAAKHID